MNRSVSTLLYLLVLFSPLVLADVSRDDLCQLLPKESVCAKADVNPIGPAPAGSFEDSERALTLRLESGRTVELKNNLEDGESSLKHILEGYLSDLQFFLVRERGWEWSGCKLIAYKTGKVLSLPDCSSFAPDSGHFFTLFIPYGEYPESIAIYSVNRDGYKFLLDFPFDEGTETVRAIWVNVGEIAIFSGKWIGGKTNTAYSLLGRLKREGDTWTVHRERTIENQSRVSKPAS